MLRCNNELSRKKMNDIKNKIGIRSFPEYDSNPFIALDKSSIKVMDIDFMSTISKRSVSVIKYLIHKKAYEVDERFVFDFKEFNEMMGYNDSKPPTCRAFVELCDKGLLARTSIPYVFWVNKSMLRDALLK